MRNAAISVVAVGLVCMLTAVHMRTAPGVHAGDSYLGNVQHDEHACKFTFGGLVFDLKPLIKTGGDYSAADANIPGTSYTLNLCADSVRPA